MPSKKISASLMDSIYLKLAEIAKGTCVIISSGIRHRIPVVKYGMDSFIFFLIEDVDQQAINMNQKMYDFFTTRGIFPDLINGCFIINRLSDIAEVVDSQQGEDLRFDSSTAQSS